MKFKFLVNIIFIVAISTFISAALLLFSALIIYFGIHGFECRFYGQNSLGICKILNPFNDSYLIFIPAVLVWFVSFINLRKERVWK